MPKLSAALRQSSIVSSARPILLAVRAQHSGGKVVQFPESRILMEFRAPEHGEHRFRLRFPLHLNTVDLHRREFVSCLLFGLRADDDGDAVVLRARLQPRGDVDRVTQHRIVEKRKSDPIFPTTHGPVFNPIPTLSGMYLPPLRSASCLNS